MASGITKFFLIFILANLNAVAELTNADCNKLYDKYYDNSLHYFKVMKNTFVVKNFNSYEELYLNCSINITNKALLYIPNRELLLDNSMDYETLFKYVAFTGFNEIFFYKVKGFNYNNNLISSFNFKYQPVCVDHSNFEFYLYGKLSAGYTR